MDNPWTPRIVTSAAAFLAGLLVWVLIPGNIDPDLKNALQAGIVLIVIVLVALAWKYGQQFWEWIAKQNAKFFLFGLRKLAEEAAARAEIGRHGLVNWVTDQLYVAQNKHAFSISCIVFRVLENGELECLLERNENFPRDDGRPTLTWPGGRFTGLQHDIERELKDKVYRDTGYTIRLLRLLPDDRMFVTSEISEPIATWNPSEGHNARNHLFIPPLVVMRQNRPQSHNVPGHIDLVYLAEIDRHVPRASIGNPEWVALPRIFDTEQWDKTQFWEDTRQCIARAAPVFLMLKERDDAHD